MMVIVMNVMKVMINATYLRQEQGDILLENG